MGILHCTSPQDVVRETFLFFFSSNLLCSPFFSLSLLGVTQIRGHIAGSSPPSPLRFEPCIFIAKIVNLFLPSSTRVALYALYTRQTSPRSRHTNSEYIPPGTYMRTTSNGICKCVGHASCIGFLSFRFYFSSCVGVFLSGLSRSPCCTMSDGERNDHNRAIPQPRQAGTSGCKRAPPFTPRHGAGLSFSGCVRLDSPPRSDALLSLRRDASLQLTETPACS